MTAPSEERYDLIVIGGGTAGMTAAREVAKTGRRVALIEAERTGGDCLLTGCVPSKTLLASAKTVHQVRRARELGVATVEPALDWAAIQARRERVIERIGVHDAPVALERDGVEVIHGRGRFVGPRRVAVEARTLEGRAVVIATGSRPAVPPIPGLADAGYLTNVELLSVAAIPRRLAVIGAGPTGVELGQAFARFGSAVTIVEREGRILPRDDVETAGLLQTALADEGIDLRLGREVAKVERTSTGRTLTLRPAVPFTQVSEPASTAGRGLRTQHSDLIEVDEILIATGRTPNVAGLELHLAGVAVGSSGIEVDDRLQTSSPAVWACGDVIGPPYLTHAAEDQARTVARNVLGGRAKWSGRALPWATFADPEVAGVGLTEADARAHYGDKLEVLRLPYGDVDRAVTDRQDRGLVKVLLAPGWTRGRLGGEVVGAHAAGERAAEIVQQFAFLMAWRLPAGMLAKVPQAYPTYGLGARQAVGLHWLASRSGADGRNRSHALAKLRSLLGA